MLSKKILIVAAAAVMLIALVAGCGGGATQPTTAPAVQPTTASAAQPTSAAAPSGGNAKTAKYGLFMSHMTNEFTIELSGAVKAEADKLGVNITVYDGGNDAAKQLSQVETAITQGINAIIIEPVSVDGIIPAAQAAQKANIPFVAVNQNISKPELVTTFVGVSHETGGETEAKLVADALGGKGNIAILLGPMGSDAELGRRKGYQNILDKNPNMKVVFEQTANWNTDEALKLMENWLQTGTQIDAVLSENDNMALGAVKAIQDAKLGDKIKVFGIDATPDALKAVKAGQMVATVSQSTSEQGKQAMDAAFKILNGEKVDKQILVNYTVIDKNNVDKFIKQ